MLPNLASESVSFPALSSSALMGGGAPQLTFRSLPIKTSWGKIKMCVLASPSGVGGSGAFQAMSRGQLGPPTEGSY